MTLNRVKLGHAVTFIEYLDSAVSLIFIALTLIWNKINFLKSCAAGGKWVYEQYLQKKLPIFVFLFDLSLLNVKISRAHN